MVWIYTPIVQVYRALIIIRLEKTLAFGHLTTSYSIHHSPNTTEMNGDGPTEFSAPIRSDEVGLTLIEYMVRLTC